MRLYRFAIEGHWGFDDHKDGLNLRTDGLPWRFVQSFETNRTNEADWRRQHIDRIALVDAVNLYGCFRMNNPNVGI